MPKATNVTEAAYEHFAKVDRSVWELDPELPGFMDLYVDRRESDPDPEQPTIPVFNQIKHQMLNARGPSKVFLTGQKGSGKSMELRRVLEDSAIQQRFELVSVIISERIDIQQHVDIRYLLLVLAASLADHIVEQRFDQDAGWVDQGGASLDPWIQHLARLQSPEAPSTADDFKLGIKIPLVELSAALRSDEQIREKILKSDAFSVTAVTRLVSDLIVLIGRLAKRDVLLILDDGDKLTDQNTARGIFIEHAGTLERLPCRAVITFPYWLHFDQRFHAVTTERPVHVLANIKVAHRETPQEVLPGAFLFFKTVYSRLVEPGAKLIEPENEVIAEAVRHSAGIPREFLRVLQRGFTLASGLDEPALTLPRLKQAVGELRRGMIPFTQTRATRQQLERIRLTWSLDRPEDWVLLDALLVVELSNDKPWYDAHPILRKYVDELLMEHRRRIGVGIDDADEVERRLLGELLGESGDA